MAEKKSIKYYLLYGAANLIAMLPFGVLYFFSDLIYPLVYYVVKYRKKVVRKNLKKSFPDKSKKEIRRIEKKFYRHLCDYFVETLKMLRISDKEARKRMRFENPEIIDRFTESGKTCFVCLGHYGNWEWVPSIRMYLKNNVEQGLIYRHLNSESFDRLFLNIRSRFNSVPIEKNSALRKIIKRQNEGKTMVIGFLTDQRPAKYPEQYWTNFLQQDTHVQVGMERIARLLRVSVVYLDIEKVKRGHYVGRFSVITPDASKEAEFAVMEQYMRRLEETVLKEPAYYLWSHNKWKFGREK
jgi:KDO2-lipid IV(A) lauroyltransferase